MALQDGYKKFLTNVDNEISVLIGKELASKIFTNAFRSLGKNELRSKDLPRDVKVLINNEH